MAGMDNIDIKRRWEIEEEKSFTGWDFSHLDNRMQEEELPWNYMEIINRYQLRNYRLLDMGTGGGEFLLTLEHPYSNTFVTESYLPNVDLCKKKLGSLGIDVRQVIDDSDLPFDNESIDIIINRHESYDVKEVFRVLKRNGIFITQQVGAMNNLEFSNLLLDGNRIKNLDHSFEVQVENAKDIGFEILDAEEYFPYIKFFDVGALVYFAKIIEWEFQGFSVERCFEKLLELHSRIESNGFVESMEHRFLIVAKKIMD